MAEVRVALLPLEFHAVAHLEPVEAVERVALDVRGRDALAAEDLVKVLLTVVVPAPDDPVMAMTGYLVDIARFAAP